MAKIRRKISWKNIIAFLFFILFSITLILSSVKIVKWMLDNKNTDKKINDINEVTKIEETNEGEIIKNEVDKSDPYWDYIKMNLINVDFSKLKEQNSDIKGWIQVKGTNINYPFVQTKDNSYYLNHSIDKSFNGVGWVFLDYRNSLSSLTEKNTIIYAHGRQNGTMFGSLRNILTSNWINNKDNYVIKLSTEYENTLWQVFSCYKIPTTNDYLQINFNNNEFAEFTKKLIDRSNYKFNTKVSNDDRILTLSTCYNNDDKVVLHAKLIKREVR